MPSVSARFPQHSAPPYPPERLLLRSNQEDHTRQDNTTLLGARGATPAFPSPPASHRSLLTQTACVRRFREKNETLTKKCNPHKKKLKKKAHARIVLELIITVGSQRI